MKKRDSNQLCVCIPAFNEPRLLETLSSLAMCKNKGLFVKVMILINGSEKDEPEIRYFNQKVFLETQGWIKKYAGNVLFECILEQEMPIKHAGVGLARKILGDKASEDFRKKGQNGIVAYLDADCTVEENYFQSICSFFGGTDFSAAAVNFEHQIKDENQDRAIMEYEAHLRYYILMQRFINLPFAIHTVGSSMACLSEAFISKGGMNKRKAGEDFYFLQKFIKDGECGIIKDTTVYPSSRISERVPFGTGRAMMKYEKEGFEWLTYNPQSFLLLKPFVDRIGVFFQSGINFEGLDKGLTLFLTTIEAKKNIENIKQNVASLEAFEKRFFQFFDAFQLMKYLHFMRDQCGVTDVPIMEALKWYMKNVKQGEINWNLYTLLNRIREIDNEY